MAEVSRRKPWTGGASGGHASVSLPFYRLRRRTIALEAFAVWGILCLIYFLTLSGNHTEAEDGLLYLRDIRDGEPSAIFSPYHLIYG